MSMVERVARGTARATVRIRRGDKWDVRPESEVLDGRIFTFQYGWTCDDSRYLGEVAWMIVDPGDWYGFWISSGDLDFDAALSE